MTQLETVTYTADEMMAVAAARRLRNGTVCFVGIGAPSRAANLARALVDRLVEPVAHVVLDRVKHCYLL